MYLRVFFLPTNLTESSSFLFISVSSSFPHISLLTYRKSHSRPAGICGTFPSAVTYLSVIFLPTYLRFNFSPSTSESRFHLLICGSRFTYCLRNSETSYCYLTSVLFSFLSAYLSVVFLPVAVPQRCFLSCRRTSVLLSFLLSFLGVVCLPVILLQCCFPSCHFTSFFFLPVIVLQCCFPSYHITSGLFSFLSSYLSVVSFLSS
jgi:hypothetical protein